MNLDIKKHLNIVLIDHDDGDLFKSMSAINNQIGFDLKKEVCINLLTDRNISDDLIDSYNFSYLDVTVNKIQNKNYRKDLNSIITSSQCEWITFMDSRDSFFADGSLLDFIHFSESSEDKHDMFIFKYIYQIKNENNETVGFEANQFTNIIFGKYFNVDFLHQNKIMFNEKLDHYLFDDFASKSIKICNNAILYDLLNYYLAPRSISQEPAMEFMNYRIDFIKFIKDHTNDNIFNDISWSIVQSFSMLQNQHLLNNEYKDKLNDLYKFAVLYDNYNDQLANEFNNQLGNEESFYEFKKFLGV
ncbi:hypothetical protein ACYATM_00245 [Lactobacillaceae bacterium Scapto_B20]